MAEPKAAEAKPAESVAGFKKEKADIAVREEAFKDKLVAQANAIIAELKDLGFEYTLTEGGSGNGKKNKCGECGAEGHSARTCPNKKK